MPPPAASPRERRPRSRSRLGLVAVLAIALLLPAELASAGTPRFVKTLAGRSIAAMYPSGVEWDARNKRLVIADTGLDRILFYRVNGTKLGGFGRHGAGPGRFNSPRDVAIDGAGNIYVADAGNNRVQKFSANGKFRWQVGGTGPCNSCLNTPIGVTWDRRNGVLLVASTGQSLLKAFNPNGSVAWVSPSGSQLGIGAPRDIARGPDGKIWVADYKNHRVKAFDVSNNGTFSSTDPAISLGGQGGALGQLRFPYNMAFSPNGNTLYVSDTGNNRVARWNLTTNPPSPLPQIGRKCDAAPDPCPNPPADWGTIDTLRRVITVPKGRIVTADFWGNGLQVWKTTNIGNGTTDAMVGQIELRSAKVPGFAQAFGVDVGPDGRIYAVDRLNQRVQGFNRNGSFFGVGGSRGTQPGRVSWPEAVAVAPNGRVWVADTRGDRVMRFPANLADNLTANDVFGTSGKGGAGEFNYIEDLDVAPDGRVYIADTRNDRIQVLNPATGAFSIFPASESLSGPQGVAVTSGYVFVADTKNDRILRFSRATGQLQRRFATGLKGPQGVAAGSDGTVWVADTRNHRIVHLSARLTNLRDTFGKRGTGKLRFNLPHTLAAKGNRLYVADTFNHRVQIFNIKGL